MLKELLSTNGTLSTTSTVQFIGSVAVIGLTIYAVVTEQPYAMTLLNDLLLYLFGATTAKGIVTTFQAKLKGGNDGQTAGISAAREVAQAVISQKEVA
ncbi:DUF2644 domain-containing protein [Actinobacillus minor]|uniref:DUF2644 domain-containing protein n=1 Tax=Actinobacillus minor TaxID=51047 RepID=UPI0023F160AD|nr:DUF2644 domain-containing protein [Actinobacillus minor]MDD6911058.1 DUF2644 domain-containing protein [Actinobacillus minor]MDY4713742.1 DUF2644 domain-containing protein [Actinobacillus minor]